ncbi:hypothetical protein F5144DRAFT_546257 [Chaetomium tenue]|uniref:Uncharacterized protein n=1 Tax=Chaetomium tenue TaxID=1854479 RepID=A0ACB7PA91_9PEZI|nr:hypothetical protein F5144DRAFT_546257 [Chaetomium globosum]
MPMTVDDYRLSEPMGPQILENSLDEPTSHFSEREAKKQRLRELRESYHCVGTIVNHMGRYYKTKDPPPWLDLRLVAGQILRSAKPHTSPSNHPAWKYLRDSMTSILGWMHDHDNWEDAVKVSKMPHLGFRSEIKATEFFDGRSGFMPRPMMVLLQQIELDFLMEPQPPSNDDIPYFWRGADVDDPAWRSRFMQRQCYHHHIPFDDDLTDLVLSVVCQEAKPKPEDPDRFLKEAKAEENDEHFEPSREGLAATADAKTDDSGDAGTAWKNRVQATMFRIADTVNEALAAEKTKLLGKRDRQEKDKVQVEAQNKRRKAGETGPRQQGVVDSIEDSDDEDGLPSPPPVEDDKYRALKAGLKKLKKQDQQLACLYSSLDENTKKQGKDVEQLTKQQKDLRKDTNANKQKQQQLAEKVANLETEKKTLEEQAQQLAVQCAALTDDIRKLEDKSGQVAAKCSAFEDENKLLRSQVVNLISRVETLESAPKPVVEPTQTVPAVPASAPEPTSEPASVRPRQHFVAEVSRSGGGAGLRDIVDGGAAPTTPSSQWQCAGVAKYEYMAGRSTDQPPPPRYYERAGSRFPRILNMPTFDPSWNPQQEILRSRNSGYTQFSQRTTYSDTIYATDNPPSPYSYPEPAAGAPSPVPNPAQQPIPAELPIPVQTQMPTSSRVPAPSPLPVSTSVPVPAPTQPQYPTAAPVSPLPCLRPEPSSS